MPGNSYFQQMAREPVPGSLQPRRRLFRNVPEVSQAPAPDFPTAPFSARQARTEDSVYPALTHGEPKQELPASKGSDMNSLRPVTSDATDAFSRARPASAPSPQQPNPNSPAEVINDGLFASAAAGNPLSSAGNGSALPEMDNIPRKGSSESQPFHESLIPPNANPAKRRRENKLPAANQQFANPGPQSSRALRDTSRNIENGKGRPIQSHSNSDDSVLNGQNIAPTRPPRQNKAKRENPTDGNSVVIGSLEVRVIAPPGPATINPNSQPGAPAAPVSALARGFPTFGLAQGY